jgi:hypothetical protein
MSKQTSKYILFTKANRTAITGHQQHARSHRAAAVPSAAVVHSGLYTRCSVLLKPTHCNNLLRLQWYSSFSRKLTTGAAGCLAVVNHHRATERRPPLASSAFNLTVDVFTFCVLLCIGPQLDSASR